MARRAGGPGGRFDHRFEADSIESGIIDELQEPFGSVVQWYVYDVADSTVDAIYDTAQSDANGGKVWTGPYYVPVVSANLKQGHAPQVEHEGYYNVDNLLLVAAIQTVKRAGIIDIARNPSKHLADRIVWRGEVWKPSDIQPRGLVGPSRYTVLAITCDQISPEEMDNDVTFQNYADLGTSIVGGSAAMTEVSRSSATSS
jgi:hypothetical protein